MRHRNKHHHRQKDQKTHKAAIFNHAYSQLFSSAENPSLSYKTCSKLSSGRKLQLRLYSLLSSTFMNVPSWLTSFYLANH